MLSRDELLAAGGRRGFVDVDCTAEAGGMVRVAVMSGLERDEWDRQCRDNTDSSGENADMPHLRAVLVCLAACDAQGGRLLTLDDVPAVKTWQAPLLWKVYQAAFDVNLLGARHLETAEKN